MFIVQLGFFELVGGRVVIFVFVFFIVFELVIVVDGLVDKDFYVVFIGFGSVCVEVQC